MTNTGNNFDRQEEEIDLLDYVNIIIKRRRMILRNTLVAAFGVALISFFLPKAYTAKTTLLPPDDSDTQGLRGLLADTPASFLNLSGVPVSSSEIFVEILKSRTVAEGVLKANYDYDGEKKNLREIWDIDSKGSALSRLQSRTRISSNEQGVIEVAVEMRSPELAAQVANQFVQELDRVNQQKSLSKAKNSRLYIEEQLKNTEKSLKDASEALAKFQSQYKAVNLEEQTKIAIEKAGEIKGTIMAKEVQLQVALQMMKPNNPHIVRLQKELDELKKQFEHLQFGNSVAFEEQKDYFIPFSDVPEVGRRYAELIREVKVQETVWQLLNQQYYTTKIQEARDTPTVQMLDEPVPPEKRSKPNRKLLVLVAGFLTFTFSIFGAFVMEYFEKVKQQEDEYRKVSHITGELKKDYDAARNFVKTYWQKIRRK